jgi:hypothetical protein
MIYIFKSTLKFQNLTLFKKIIFKVTVKAEILEEPVMGKVMQEDFRVINNREDSGLKVVVVKDLDKVNKLRFCKLLAIFGQIS